MSDKIQINPHEAPKFVRQSLDAIANAVLKSTGKFVAEPGAKYFSKIAGDFSGHTFEVRHILPKDRSESEKLYVAYDNYEFYSDIVEVSEYLESINAHIQKHFIYDMNSKTFVPRPRELSDWQLFKQKFAALRGKTK